MIFTAHLVHKLLAWCGWTLLAPLCVPCIVPLSPTFGFARLMLLATVALGLLVVKQLFYQGYCIAQVLHIAFHELLVHLWLHLVHDS